MANQRKIIGKIPVYRGNWSSSNAPYHKLNDVTLYGCMFRSKIENNSYQPATIGAGGELVVNENWYLVTSGYESEAIKEDLAFIDNNTNAYNVSRFHSHTGFWEAIEYDESQPAYMEAQQYSAGSKVNLVNYTNHTFVAMKSLTGVQPDINTVTNKFTLEEAVLLVPKKYQLSGIEIGFISSETNKPVFHRYNGGTFTSVDSWTGDTVEKLTELGLQSVYIGMHTQEAEINISAKTEESDCIFTINIPGYVYSEKESFDFGKTLTVSIKSDGLNKFYINKDTKEILVKDYGQVLWEDGYWLFLGFAYINVNQGTMSNHMFFGRYKYNGETYYNSSKEVYDVGIPCPHMIFGMWSTIPNFTLENSILSCPDLGLVMCTNGNAFYRSLPAVNLTIDTSTFGDSTIVIYNINTKNYSQIKYTGNINSFKEGDYIVGFLRLGKEFYANGIYLFNKKEKQYAGISDTESLNQFSYKNGIIGIDTEVAEITTSKDSNNYLFSIKIPRYIYIDNKCINVGKNYDKSIPINKTGLYRIYLKSDLTDVLLSAYNEEKIELGNIFLGVFTLNTDGSINKPFFKGKVKINGVTYSSFNTEVAQSDGDKSVSVSEQDMQMYLYPKLYLIKGDKYVLFKNSFYYNKNAVDYTPYDGKDTFQYDRTDIVSVTDMEVNSGISSVQFESSNIRGLQQNDGITEKYIGIYVNTENTEKWVSGGKINVYGVRCKVDIADNINGKSIKYTAVGDSQTDNGQVENTKYYLNEFDMTLIGVGLKDNHAAGNKGEGRSGWRYENIVGRSNAMGWSGIEVITPNGEQKNTTDLLHNNPFLKIATDEDKRLHPTRCYTFTANQQTTANYLEKSYQEVVDESGDTEQNFYIYDIANYYKIQHDWDGEGNPVDAISFAFSTNEFLIEGFTEDVVDRLLDNLQWILDRTREQLPGVKIAVIPCPAWSYGTNKNKYYTFILPVYFKEMCEFIDNYNSINSSDVAIVQPHIFMDRAYSYTKGSNSPSNIDENVSMIKKYTTTDAIHFGMIGYQQYAKAIGGWLANIVE